MTECFTVNGKYLCQKCLPYMERAKKQNLVETEEQIRQNKKRAEMTKKIMENPAIVELNRDDVHEHILKNQPKVVLTRTEIPDDIADVDTFSDTRETPDIVVDIDRYDFK